MKKIIILVALLASVACGQNPDDSLWWDRWAVVLTPGTGFTVGDSDGCYIVCEKLDTVGYAQRTYEEMIPCPSGILGCCVLHMATRTVWEPVTEKRELCRIPISCDDAAKIDIRYLKVIR